MAAINILANTSTIPKVLVSTQLSATTETTVYTAPTSSGITVKSGVICNTAGSPVTINLSVVPSGGTAGSANRVIAGYILAPNDSLDLRGYLTGAVLGDGDFLSMLVGTANAVNINLTGLVSS